MLRSTEEEKTEIKLTLETTKGLKLQIWITSSEWCLGI